MKVCDPPPSSYLPPAPRSLQITLKYFCGFGFRIDFRQHDQGRRGKPDPIGDLIRGVGDGVAKIVGDLEKTLQKLVDPKVHPQKYTRSVLTGKFF